MLIRDSVLQDILKCADTKPPESGGIIGINNNGIVCDYYHDFGIKTDRMCRYAPNTVVLNQVIASWKEMMIRIGGLYHTHYFGVSTLSKNDMNYISKILMSMPSNVNFLYFPLVVVPQYEMVPYIAKRENGAIRIELDNLIIVKGGE